MNQENHSDKLLEEVVVSSLRESKNNLSIPLNFSSKVMATLQQRASYKELIKWWGARCAFWIFCLLIGVGAYLFSIDVSLVSVKTFLSTHYLMSIFPLFCLFLGWFINDVVLRYYCEKYKLPD